MKILIALVLILAPYSAWVMYTEIKEKPLPVVIGAEMPKPTFTNQQAIDKCVEAHMQAGIQTHKGMLIEVIKDSPDSLFVSLKSSNSAPPVCTFSTSGAITYKNNPRIQN